jgi:hypothetical protein
MAWFCDLKAAEMGIRAIVLEAEAAPKAEWKSSGEKGNILERMVPAGSECEPCNSEK